MEKANLDAVLVPLGFIVMVVYHIWLLHQIVRHPATTIIGINAINRRFWVRAMMQDTSKTGVLAVQTLRNNIMASSVLASTTILLSSLIAVMMTDGGVTNSQHSDLIYGDTSRLGFSLKFFSILVCFLLAFLLTMQSIRYYSYAGMLINVPSNSNYKGCVTADYVGKILDRGSYFWSLGLRAFYFSFPLFLWIFGPIPMFLCCIVLVGFLYFLDVGFGFGWVCDSPDIVAQNSEEDEHDATNIDEGSGLRSQI